MLIRKYTEAAKRRVQAQKRIAAAEDETRNLLLEQILARQKAETSPSTDSRPSTHATPPKTDQTRRE